MGVPIREGSQKIQYIHSYFRMTRCYLHKNMIQEYEDMEFMVRKVLEVYKN